MIRKYKCLNCGKEIIDKRHPKRIRKYCSNKCQWEHQRKVPLYKNCLYCGRIFKRRKPDQEFCSHKCYRLYRGWPAEPKEKIKCPICGKIFEDYKSNKRKYCSRACSSKAHMGDNNPLKKWNRQRKGKSYEELYGHAKAKKLKEQKRAYAYKARIWENVSNPSNLELFFSAILSYFGFRHVGDGKLWLGSMNPDFIHKDKNKIVEILGNYWHTKEEIEQRTKKFNSMGFEVLNIWEKEWRDNPRDVIQRIRNFA